MNAGFRVALFVLLFFIGNNGANAAPAEDFTLDNFKAYDVASSLTPMAPPVSMAALQNTNEMMAEPAFGERVILNKRNGGGWYKLSLRNYTDQPNWVLRFAKPPLGIQGGLNAFAVYDITNKRWLLNATRGKTEASLAVLTMPKGQYQNYAIYMAVPPGWNFEGHLVAHPLFMDVSVADETLNRVVIGLLAALAVCLFLTGLAYQPVAGICAAAAMLFPLLYSVLTPSVPLAVASLTYIYQGLWLMAAQMLFLVTTIMQTRERMSSLINVALFVGQVVTGILIASVAAGNIMADNFKILILALAPLIPLGATLFVIISNAMYRTSIGRAATYATIAGLACYALYFIDQSLHTPLRSDLLPWIGLLLQGLWYIRLLFACGEGIFAERLRLESLKLKEAEQLARLKQSKEAADQARLMRVIEREREVMEELREREAQRTEDMRQAKEIADEANRAKSAFLAVVSHEIRNPMTGIMGMISLLNDSPHLHEKEREYTHTIKQSGSSMLKLLNDILDFSKIERDSLELEEIEFDLRRAMRNLTRLLSGQAQEKDINLLLDMSDDLPQFVRGDPSRLQQVLLNLLNNAIKFTPSGSVVLHVNRIAPAVEDIEARYLHHIVFAVSDTGIGISPDAQKSIFSPFAQADTSITRKFGGTGLGLAISKRLVEAMGGMIALKSAPGEGSTFSFTLHMQEGFSDQTIAEIVTDDYTVPMLRILVVEDNQINQRVIKEILENSGHKITIAGTGKEGVVLAQQNEYDLILMDDELPEMRGDMATKTIRLNPGPCQEIDIVGLTGNTSVEDRERLIASGMNDVLVKPIEPQVLKNLLVNLFGKRIENTDPVESFEPPVQTETSATGASSIPVIDQKALDDLYATLGSNTTKELVESLWTQADSIVAEIDTAIAANDTELLGRKGHEMKGMAGNFGFVALSHAGSILEKAGKSKDASASVYVASTMKDLLAKSREAFEKYISEK